MTDLEDVVASARRRVGEVKWNLDRFGLTPHKVAHRLKRARGGPRVVCTSVPKAGTHLLERALCMHPHLYRKSVRTVHGRNLADHGGAERLVGSIRPSEVLVTHLTHEELYPALAGSGARSLFMIRDPRDIVVSQANYILAQPSHHLYRLMTSIDDPQQRLSTLIVGDPANDLPSLGERLDSFLPWLEDADLTVRFEDLVGPRGGGERKTQVDTLSAVYATLGIGPPFGDLERAAHGLFSETSPTFRRGMTGQWRDTFDADLVSLFVEVAGEASLRYGYPVSP